MGDLAALGGAAQRRERGVVGQVELQRRHRDIAVVDRLEVAVVGERLLDAVEAEPVIGVAARVDALDDRAAAVVVEALPHDANTLDLLRGQGGKIDVDEGRSEEHTSELQSLMRISYAVFCLKKNK